MYHTNKLNQEKHFNKTLSSTKISQKDFHTDHFTAYVATSTPLTRKVFYYIYSFRNKPWIKLRNECIAKAIGCSLRTVIRATNQFHKDGLITKHQDNKYAPNYFTLNEVIKKSKYSFNIWFNSLSPQNQDLYINHGVRVNHENKTIFSIRNVTQSKNLILENSLSRRVCVSSRARSTQKTFKLRKVMNAVQKQLILTNRHAPNIKEILNSPSIKTEIITPTIEKIATLLTLDEKEQFKLIPFREDVLAYVLGEVETVIARKDTPRITNRMQWLIALATNHSKEHHIKIDWSWYYDLCEIVGVPTKVESKPLVIKREQRQRFVPELSTDDRLAKLKKELKAREDRFAIYSGSFGDKKIIANLKQEIEKMEGNSDEKQDLPYQHNTNIMEPYCATS